jgi:hypothetical protein
MILMRQLAIALGIAILYPMIVYYGVSSFHPAPKIYERVYASARIAPTTAEEEKAREQEDRAAEQRHKQEQEAVDKVTRPFFRTLILVAAPLGVLAILVGSFVKLPAIGTGLILGGMSTVADGYWGYWDHLDDWVRFVSLLVGLCILVFIGRRRFFVAGNGAI